MVVSATSLETVHLAVDDRLPSAVALAADKVAKEVTVVCESAT